MTNDQRIAMARIISDMIRADNIIEESEIRDMKLLMAEYDISQRHLSEARKIKFADAVADLQDLPQRDRMTFIDHIYRIALSDKVCVPHEALLLLALKYCLVDIDKRDEQGRRLPKPYLVSCITGDASINEPYMVYVESTYDEECNAEIENDFRLLVTQSKLAGFNFIYIPKMVEEFKKMDAQYVKDVISYMAPNLETSFVEDVYARLCNMTTKDFFHNVLYERLQVKMPYDAPPSLLINVGTSVVPYCAADGSVQYYTEFLCLPISDTTLALVDEVLAFYQDKVSVKAVTVTDNKGQFKYFGFYKALFDFLIAPPPVAPRLVFLGQNVQDNKYYVAFCFENGSERKVHLTPARYQIYFDVAYRSYRSRAKGLPTNSAPATSISHIKSILLNELQDVTFRDQYIPSRNGNVYSLRLDASKVFVKVRKQGDPFAYEFIPIKDYTAP